MHGWLYSPAAIKCKCNDDSVVQVIVYKGSTHPRQLTPSNAIHFNANKAIDRGTAMGPKHRFRKLTEHSNEQDSGSETHNRKSQQEDGKQGSANDLAHPVDGQMGQIVALNINYRSLISHWRFLYNSTLDPCAAVVSSYKKGRPVSKLSLKHR